MESIDLPLKPAMVWPYPKKPFSNIAFIASGGGFRAAAYTLGALSYLNQLPCPKTTDLPDQPPSRLLDHVTYMASASGGSLATAFYANSLVKSESFEEFYTKFLQLLTGTSTLAEVSKMLSDNKQWLRHSKRRNLINAFAKVYDQHLDELTLGQLMNQPTHHVREFCFNTTEFKFGLSFRFQTQGSGFKNQVGSHRVRFRDDKKVVSERLKVGDIIAASSCFPAGFEPMLFPDDFTHENLSEKCLRTALALKAEEVFGLMDGGITDNQAVQSVMLADRRLQDGQQRDRTKPPTHRFSMVIITDVSNLYSPCYAPSQAKKSWWRPLRLPWILGTSIVLTILAIVGLFRPNHVWNIAGALVLIPVALPLVLTVYLIVKNKFKRKPSLFWRNGIQPFLRYFTNLRLGTLCDMLVDRFNSVNILSSDVMLKRIRRGDFDKLFGNPTWKFRRVSNFIYDLSTTHQRSNQKTLEKKLRSDTADAAIKASIPAPTQTIQDTAERARLMDTTLWFTEKQEGRLRDIVSTGQFTTCYNLLYYLLRLEKEQTTFQQLDAAEQTTIAQLKTRLLDDWRRFQSDPFWQYTAADKTVQPLTPPSAHGNENEY